jgi:type II secretion system protein N
VKRRSSRLWIIIVLLYGVGATLSFLYVRFPFDRLERWAVSRLAQQTDVRLHPEGRRVGWPMHVYWQTVGVEGLPHVSRGVLKADHVSLNVSLLSALEGVLSTAFEFRTLDGLIKGVTEWRGDVETGEYHVRGVARDLDLSEIQDHPMTAQRLRADWDYRWTAAVPLEGRGMLTLDASGVSVRASVIPGLPALTFRRVTARLDASRGVIAIEDLRGESDEGIARGRGTITPRETIGESRMNIVLELRFHAGTLPQGSYRLTLQGTIDRPRFSLDAGQTG